MITLMTNFHILTHSTTHVMSIFSQGGKWYDPSSGGWTYQTLTDLFRLNNLLKLMFANFSPVPSIQTELLFRRCFVLWLISERYVFVF